MVGEVGKSKIMALEKLGEDEIFERIASGVSLASIKREFNIGHKLWAKWLDASDGRRGRYQAAQLEAGHFYAERALETAPLAEREEAKAFSELELNTADPLTIVLSDKGWIRAAKGHEIDPESLSYKSGDGFRFAARGKSNLPTVVLDSTGRAYTLPTHQLPSARGQGEPLTGRINPPSGATFQGLLTGAEDDRFLLASDAGYGFVVQFGQLQAKNKAGKAVLTLPKNAQVLSPAAIAAGGQDPLVVVATNEGRMLVFPLADLPELARGKGNKLIGIPSARAAAREEFVAGLCVVAEGDTLQVTSGGHYRNFKWSELEHFRGERGRRGSKLPKGYQRVTRLQVVTD